MKSVMMGRHILGNNPHGMYFWNYNGTTGNYWNANTARYAVVDTAYGYQLVEVLGVGEVKDDVRVNRNVIAFLSNEYFESFERADNE